MPAFLRPEPLDPDPSILDINGNARYRQVEQWLTRGQRVCITDTYGTALTLYSWLKRTISRRSPATDYRTSRLFRELFWQLTRPLLAPIAGHRIALRNAPVIPFLEYLYLEKDNFLLPLAELLGLNGAYQWYHQGIRYPVLDHPLHPFYGAHFSTRSEHLELFDGYLNERQKVYACAADIGAGAGALTFLLLKHNIPQLHATDTSQNAIHSLDEDLERLQLRHRVELAQSNLFGALPPVELVAFNPPWLPGERHVPVDAGSYYPPDLFPRFFDAAEQHLKPNGRVVILVSNFAELAGLTSENPIGRELATGNRFRLTGFWEKPVGAPSRRRGEDWLFQLRQRERVQLWELASH